MRWARSTRFALKLDVRKFFPSLDHLILEQQIRRVIKDPEVLWLCDLIIDSSCPQERLVQHFPGDDFVKDRLRVRRYLRYVDDFACFHDDKARLTELRHAISEHLLGLRLRLNERKSRVRQLGEGVEFLGFVVRPDRVRLNSRAVRRQRRRNRRLRVSHAAGELSSREVEGSLRGWLAHAAHGDTWRLRRDVARGVVAAVADAGDGRVS